MIGGFITENARLRRLASKDKTHFVPLFGNLIHGLNDSFDIGLVVFSNIFTLSNSCYECVAIDHCLIATIYIPIDICVAGSIWDQRRVKWFPGYRLARPGSSPECWEQVIKCICILLTSRTSELLIYIYELV